MAAARPLAVALALLAAPALAGCLELHAAHVPDPHLTGGWTKDEANSDEEPSSTAMGTTRLQKLAYKDEAKDGRGYPGFLVIYTARTLVAPDDEDLRSDVQEQVRSSVQAQGVEVEASPFQAARTLANGAESLLFAYNGTIKQTGALFTAKDARVKVVGEIFQCRAERTTVIAVGLAQVSDVRTLGGIPYSTSVDPATWRELVADPSGTVEGHKGSAALLYNVACS